MTTPAVLVVGPAWIGDMVMAHSLLQLLQRRTPAPVVDVLAPAWTRPLLARMPEVRAAIELPLGHGQLGLGRRRQLARQLRGRYQQAIVLPNSWKSALIPFWAGIPQRTGWHGELRWGLLNDRRRLDRRRLPLTVQRFNALALAPGTGLPPVPAPRLAVDPGQQAATLAKFAVASDPAPILALCPGAEYGPSKRWPPAHFARLAGDRLAAGWRVWLFGSASDRAAADAINQAVGRRALDFCGRTELDEAIDLLALASAVVSNDSGLLHIAAALERPLIALYGSTDPGHTPPLSDRAQVLRLGLDCSPCFRRQCPLGHHRCLVDLEPEQVLAALAGRPPPSGANRPGDRRQIAAGAHPAR